MQRFHVHMRVEDLPQNIQFYTALFSQNPTIVKEDYAKWMLDDPRINFALSTHGESKGINHLGIELESSDAFEEASRRFKKQQADFQEPESS